MKISSSQSVGFLWPPVEVPEDLSNQINQISLGTLIKEVLVAFFDCGSDVPSPSQVPINVTSQMLKIFHPLHHSAVIVIWLCVPPPIISHDNCSDIQDKPVVSALMVQGNLKMISNTTAMHTG